MKQTIRLTESELNNMIMESVMEIMGESFGDWNGLESNKYITVNGQKYKESEYKKYKKNKKDGESFEGYKERMKKERADKSAATRADKKERAEAKKSGLTLKKYRNQKEQDDKIEKAVAESIRRVLRFV